ncbi:asparagine synthase-related protein [Nocardioides maradonensis]
MVSGPARIPTDLLRSWLTDGCRGLPPVRQGFAAALLRPDGSALVAVTNRWELSLLHADSPQGTIVGTHPRDVIAALPAPPALDRTKLADLLALHDDPVSTVFEGIRRLPLGHLLRITPGRPTTVEQWFRPETEPDRGISVAEAPRLVLRAIEEAVAASLPESGPIAATLSGGLDSSTVVATAARLVRGSGRTIEAYTHVPIRGTSDPSPGWEADDGPYAAATAAHVGGIRVTPLVNDGTTTPLVASEAAIRATWQPAFNPSNQGWCNDAVHRAEAIGSPILLTGASGNFTFSRGRAGIVRDLAYAGRWRAVVADVRARHAGGLGWRPATRELLREVAPDPLLRRYRRLRGIDVDGSLPGVRDLPFRPELISDGARAELAAMSRTYRPGRRDFVESALLDNARVGFVQNLSDAVWWSDPLSDPAVISLALRLPEEAWLVGGLDRGLARTATAGLLPDVVRLRRTLGAQGADTGRIVGGRTAPYRELLERIQASPTASAVIDTARLEASLGPEFADPEAVLHWQGVFGRAFSFGQFICWYEDEVLSRPPS